MTRIKVIIHSRLIQEQAYRFSIYTDVPRYFAARNIRSTVTPVIYLDIPSRPSHKTPPPPYPLLLSTLQNSFSISPALPLSLSFRFQAFNLHTNFFPALVDRTIVEFSSLTPLTIRELENTKQ